MLSRYYTETILPEGIENFAGRICIDLKITLLNSL